MLSESAHGQPSRIVVVVFAAAALLAVLPAALPLAAQDRTQLARILENGDLDFRVRIQAAFALGNTRDPGALDPLVRALADPNPALRAAAATGLARLGNRRALTALRNHARDPSAAVRVQAERAIRQISSPDSEAPSAPPSPPPGALGSGGGLYPRFAIVPTESSVSWGSVRYVVFLGSLVNRSGYQGPQLTLALRREVSSNLHAVRSLAVLDDADHVPADHEREITRRHLPRLRLDGALSRVNRHAVSRQLSIRCEVSFMLLDEPERVMRGVLNGAATGSDEIGSQDQERRLAEQALAGAVRSALSGVGGALEQATRRR